MQARPILSRRAGLLTGLGALAVAGLPRTAAAMLPAVATLLVPGPEDGAFARFAGRLAASLGRGATSAISLRNTVLGGPDGVTAANRFATEGAPDGRTLLVLPGLAALARMVGDPRARFDATGWLPVCAAQGSAVVVGREALPAAGAAPRFGLVAPDMPGAAALLGCDLLGLAASPVLGPPRAEAALGQGVVEAVLLTGTDLPARVAALGARPWFTLEPAGMRDPLLPEVPSMFDLGLGGTPELRAAAAAAAGCVRLRAALVLPALTPANLVAAWRSAAQRWLEEEAKLGWAPGVRPLPGAGSAPMLAALSPAPAAALAYREWLLRRLNWRAD
ncbi:hypothetical protein ACFQS7_00740 [Dankookia sp. GCM10030260]|uniref:hypothetical protein n=1 Tax=Dankookia sp. GCM10030260 TaxID=3273390 RepID=UPI003618F501